MPIAVVCSGCQARFSVSEKFAGKQGPCPKCKTVITIPVPAKDEVKIHAPEEFQSGGKDVKGRPITKPIARKDARFRPMQAAVVAAAVLLVVGAAFALRWFDGGAQVAAVSLGLLVITPPLTVAGYSFLRDDELEPYRGRSLWLRAGICSLAYAVLWGLYWPLSGYLTGELWQWLFLAPVILAIGALVAHATLDLDPTSGAIHYGFFLAVTLVLRAAIGWPPVWKAVVPIVSPGSTP
jgi:hypothetical protein